MVRSVNVIISDSNIDSETRRPSNDEQRTTVRYSCEYTGMPRQVFCDMTTCLHNCGTWRDDRRPGL
jgi:hypothetical protein